MPIQITIPRLGWSMEEGTFAGWQKHDGQMVRRGDILFELEGEKALQEIEAVDEGILRIPPDGPVTGTVLKVGAVIGYLVAEGELPPWAGGAAPSVSPVAAMPSAAEKLDTNNKTSDANDSSETNVPVASPSVRRLARELGVSLKQVTGTGRDGRITDDDVRSGQTRPPAASGSSEPRSENKSAGVEHQAPFSTPRARKTAKELGIDWTVLRGSGRNGRIREWDVREAAGTRTVSTGPGQQQRQELAGRRAVIAKRMQESRQKTVPVTLTSRANAANLVSLRNQFKAAGIAPVPSYHDMIAKLVAECLVRHPLIGACRDGDTLVLPDPENICLGLAVDTEDGLIVPVLKNVRRRTLSDLTRDSIQSIDKARRGRLSSKDLTGAIFTISSLGSQGIDGFTPIINTPETAILGLGAIRKIPIVGDDDRVVVGQEMVLSLTFDHQVVDGAPAARFLQDLIRGIENPAAHLLMQGP